jgi:hypothetical protein
VAPDCMAVSLHLRRMRVVRVAVDEPDRLEVVVADLRTVVATRRAAIGRGRCMRRGQHGCGTCQHEGSAPR